MANKKWQLPPAAVQLLTELQDPDSYPPSAKLVIFSEEEGELTLSGLDAAKILSDPLAVEQLYNAIDADPECTVEYLYEDIDADVVEKLETFFSYVEEL